MDQKKILYQSTQEFLKLIKLHKFETTEEVQDEILSAK